MIIDKSELFIRDITPEYLDRQHLHLHWSICNSPEDRYHYHGNPSKLLSLTRPFIVDLCSYLYTNGIEVGDITVEVGDNGGVLLSLGNGVMITMLYRPLNRPSYKIGPLPWDAWDDFTYSTLVLPDAIRYFLGYSTCASCIYSSDCNNYCGLGIEMYDKDCSSMRTISPAL